MVMPGETIALGAADRCPECQVELKVTVCQSAAGYYIGTHCNCGPYSRESRYYRTEGEATADMGTFTPRGTN